MPSATPACEIRRAVQDLGAAAWVFRNTECRPLHTALIRSMRRHPLRLMFADTTRPRVFRLEALAGAIALAQVPRPAWRGQAFVGILLPPGVAAALANFAAAQARSVAPHCPRGWGEADPKRQKDCLTPGLAAGANFALGLVDEITNIVDRDPGAVRRTEAQAGLQGQQLGARLCLAEGMDAGRNFLPAVG